MTDTTARYPESKRLKTSAKARLIYRRMLADIALDYYNSKNRIEDDSLDVCSFTGFYGSWSHISFNAEEDSSINEFFAEIQYVNLSEPSVTTCKIFKKGCTKVGCESCKSVTHPMSDDDDMDWKHDKIFGEGSLNKIPYSPNYDPTSPKIISTYKSDYLIKDIKFLDMEAHFGNIRLVNIRIGNRALDHYNKTHGTKFVLVDDDILRCKPFSETWIHCAFNAMDSSVKQCNAEDSHSPMKLFFAEIKYSRVSMPVVAMCRIVEGETKIGCENCKFCRVIHPVEGYRGELLENTKIVEEDEEHCSKVYDEEFLFGGDDSKESYT